VIKKRHTPIAPHLKAWSFIDGILAQRIFQRIIFALSIVLCFASSCFVAYHGALLHGTYNNDQLIDSYMFASYDEFREASFPAPHTMLLKWPIFVIGSLFGNSSFALSMITIVLCGVTALGFSYILFRVCRRDVVKASICICLFSCIQLLIPYESSPGSLVPVNMGMITNRNIEYVIYIMFLYLMLGVSKLTSWRALVAFCLFTLLAASDRLFALIAIVSLILGIGLKIVFFHKHPMRSFIVPTVTILGGLVAAQLLLGLLNALGIVHIPNSTSSTPFALISSVRDLLFSFWWGIRASLANLGYVPRFAFDVNTLVGFINISIIATLLLTTITTYLRYATRHSPQFKTGYWLILGSVASLLLYSLSSHPFRDSLRYMGLVTFALFFGFAVYLQQQRDTPHLRRILLGLTTFMIAISPLYFIASFYNFRKDFSAEQYTMESRISAISTAVVQNNVQQLVGEYWLLSPVKQRLGGNLAIAPTAEKCLLRNLYLTSYVWYKPRPDTKKSAVILSRKPGYDGIYNNGCTDQILTEQLQGRPDMVVELSSNKNDVLWIYHRDVGHLVR
jgi:hypothetical protein